MSGKAARRPRAHALTGPWAYVEDQLHVLASGRSPGVVYLEPSQAGALLDMVRNGAPRLTAAAEAGLPGA